MPVVLSVHAKELSTYVVTASFYDEDGNAEVPTAIKWTLTDAGGTVINAQQDIAIALPLVSVEIVLSGDDLAILPTDISSTPKRLITVEATYDSVLGLGLPLKGDAEFVIDGMVAVP